MKFHKHLFNSILYLSLVLFMFMFVSVHSFAEEAAPPEESDAGSEVVSESEFRTFR